VKKGRGNPKKKEELKAKKRGRERRISIEMVDYFSNEFK
jgi:hypothetical protein